MNEAIYCFDTASVRFAVYPEGLTGRRLVAEITEDPLRDLFGADGAGDTLVDAYQQYAATINEVALERYRAAPDEPIALGTADFESRWADMRSPGAIRAIVLAKLGTYDRVSRRKDASKTAAAFNP